MQRARGVAGEESGMRGLGSRRKVAAPFDAGLELEILEQYGGLTPEEAAGELPF